MELDQPEFGKKSYFFGTFCENPDIGPNYYSFSGKRHSLLLALESVPYTDRNCYTNLIYFVYW